MRCVSPVLTCPSHGKIYLLSQLERVQITHTVGRTGQGWPSCGCFFLCVFIACIILPCLALSTSLSRQIHTGISLPISLTVSVLDFGTKNNPTEQASLPCPNSTTRHLLFHFFFSRSLCSHGVRLVTSNK